MSWPSVALASLVVLCTLLAASLSTPPAESCSASDGCADGPIALLYNDSRLVALQKEALEPLRDHLIKYIAERRANLSAITAEQRDKFSDPDFVRRVNDIVSQPPELSEDELLYFKRKALDRILPIQEQRLEEVKRDLAALENPTESDLEILRKKFNVYPNLNKTDENLFADGTTAMVVVTHKSVVRTRRTLSNIVRYAPRNLPIFVSQDADFTPLVDLVAEFQAIRPNITHIRAGKRMNFLKDAAWTKNVPSYKYIEISFHHVAAWELVLEKRGFKHAIFVEDDVEVGADFFDLMAAGKVLLDQDPNLFCVAASNIPGVPEYATDPLKMYRTEMTPIPWGMLYHRDRWLEIKDLYLRNIYYYSPDGVYWSREFRPVIKECLYPEISRSSHFGELGGTTTSDVFELHTMRQRLPTPNTRVYFSEMDLNYTKTENYFDYFRNILRSAIVLNSDDEAKNYENQTLYFELNHSLEEAMRFYRKYEYPVPFWEKRVVNEYRGTITFRLHSNMFIVGSKGARAKLLTE